MLSIATRAQPTNPARIRELKIGGFEKNQKKTCETEQLRIYLQPFGFM
jgi:hypothetical protein